ncbi:E3 ubiquitin/ISG15 ligase TRIM25-like, partial [Clarias magur]
KLLLEVKERCQQKIQEREQELQELTQAVAFHKLSAQTALQESERIFSELVKTIKKRHSELKELIRAQVKAEVSRAENVMKQLEQEIAELKRRDTEMEELSHTEDPIYFLQLSTQTAQTAQTKSRRIFSELVKMNEKRRADLKELIRTPEKAAVSRAEKVMKQLEQEIAELRRRDPETEELSHTEDTIYFLQNFQSLITLPGSEDLPTTVVSSFLSFEEVLKSLFQLQEMLETCFIEQFVKISGG